ncbi:hypothetical protein [Puniceibacterium sediminis]|uniref:Uncharacterized protein n=1 Tax=Puniceibacterium sediminis TaxID=1608407 RepID=A0A238XLD4_9RHOB|nr:hypothetical protein [Puniceibacterium sediminis]SNR59510.1 hypothetical protein SAMN06265370_1124 [Puniceibacterium sediminis]
MIAQFRIPEGVNHNATGGHQEKVACVRTGAFSTAQGKLVWERNGLACVQAFSQQFIGERI